MTAVLRRWRLGRRLRGVFRASMVLYVVAVAAAYGTLPLLSVLGR